MPNEMFANLAISNFVSLEADFIAKVYFLQIKILKPEKSSKLLLWVKFKTLETNIWLQEKPFSPPPGL